MNNLRDSVVLVTGAGSGIGRAIAQAFRREAARVAIVGRTKAKLKQTEELLGGEGVNTFVCDVTDRDAVESVASELISIFGVIDVLVNNAGINTLPRSVSEVLPSDWDKTIETNLTGTYNFVRAVLPSMKERKDGLIINIASTAGIRTSDFAGAAYCASKHGVISLTHSINEEEHNNSIRACAICPGETDTPIVDKRAILPTSEHRAAMLKPEDVAAAAIFAAKLPRRVCSPLIVLKPLYQSLA